MPPERFPSKVDWWLAVILAVSPLIGLGVVVAGAASGDLAAALIGLLTTLGVIVLFWGAVWPVEYVIDDEVLVIRSGQIRQRVPLEQLVRARPSRNVLASPALSLDRIRLDRRGGGFLLVSPSDRAGFVEAIRGGAPSLVVEGDLAVPR